MIFLKKNIILVILSLFANFEGKRGRNAAKNVKSFLMNVLRIAFCNHPRVSHLKMLKLLHPNAHILCRLFFLKIIPVVHEELVVLDETVGLRIVPFHLPHKPYQKTQMKLSFCRHSLGSV